jgi:hypothetical protein
MATRESKSSSLSPAVSLSRKKKFRGPRRSVVDGFTLKSIHHSRSLLVSMIRMQGLALKSFVKFDQFQQPSHGVSGAVASIAMYGMALLINVKSIELSQPDELVQQPEMPADGFHKCRRLALLHTPAPNGLDRTTLMVDGGHGARVPVVGQESDEPCAIHQVRHTAYVPGQNQPPATETISVHGNTI